MGDPHHYEKAARYARAAWLRKSAPGAEKLGISYPGVPGSFPKLPGMHRVPEHQRGQGQT